MHKVLEFEVFTSSSFCQEKLKSEQYGVSRNIELFVYVDFMQISVKGGLYFGIDILNTMSFVLGEKMKSSKKLKNIIGEQVFILLVLFMLLSFNYSCLSNHFQQQLTVL
jgi:hypothetical protein